MEFNYLDNVHSRSW